MAAEALGQTGAGAPADVLDELLGDGDLHVQRAALSAAGRIGNATHWHRLAAALCTDATAKSAVAALIAGGSAALPAPDAAATDNALHRRIAMAYGRIGGPEAQARLLAWINHPNARVRSEVFAALIHAGYRPDQTAQQRLQQQIRSELGGAGWYLSAQRASVAYGTLLQQALAAEIVAARERVAHEYHHQGRRRHQHVRHRRRTGTRPQRRPGAQLSRHPRRLRRDGPARSRAAHRLRHRRNRHPFATSRPGAVL